MTEKPKTDWEAIEREFRAGQLSVREIAKVYGVTDTAIRKKAKALGWDRDLTKKVKEAVKAKLVRTDGSQPDPRANLRTEREIVETASLRALEVVTTHRRDLEQLHALKRILATRLSAFLHGDPMEGPCLGPKESAGDLLLKLANITGRLIPLERQAFNLDDESPDKPDGGPSESARDILARRLARLAQPGETN